MRYAVATPLLRYYCAKRFTPLVCASDSTVTICQGLQILYFLAANLSFLCMVVSGTGTTIVIGHVYQRHEWNIGQQSAREISAGMHWRRGNFVQRAGACALCGHANYEIRLGQPHQLSAGLRPHGTSSNRDYRALLPWTPLSTRAKSVAECVLKAQAIDLGDKLSVELIKSGLNIQKATLARSNSSSVSRINIYI